MTAPLDLTDDEREIRRVAVLDEDDVTMRLLQKLSDARAVLREIEQSSDDVMTRNFARRALAGTTAPVAVPVDDVGRCAVCAWPLAASVKEGCVRGNCSLRPRPDRLYAPERAASEAACAGCAKVARHPGEGYECMAHPSPRMAPDPVQAAYAECAEVAFDAMENYCTCSRPEPKCRTCLALVEAKREIESAAARARGGK